MAATDKSMWIVLSIHVYVGILVWATAEPTDPIQHLVEEVVARPYHLIQVRNLTKALVAEWDQINKQIPFAELDTVV